MSELGHIVYYVRDLGQSVAFYTDIVGLTLQGTIFSGRGALLSGGRTHHELLLLQVSAENGPLQGKRIGLFHAGWKVGDNIDALKTVYNKIQDAGIAVDGLADHSISQSIYMKDPDGNEVELYVDNPAIDWSNDKEWMNEPVKPLAL